MPIGSIISQPSANSLNAAYRPIVFVVSATATGGGVPPVVYCDIYVNDIYYKSQEKTKASAAGWQFDIQDACQEVLKNFIAANGGSTIITASTIFATVSCKFRSSGFDADGFITPEDTAPVQGTGSVSPVSGTGTASNTFFVVNSTLQHDQNQDFEAHMNSYKQGTWNANTFPLTHRGSLQGAATYRVCENDSDYFPIVNKAGDIPTCITVFYTLRDGTTGNVNDCGAGPTTCPIVTGIVINTEDNGDGTQTFDILWNAPDPLVTVVTIKYRINASGDPFTTVAVSAIAQERSIVLPLGIYEFQLQMSGSCNTSTTGSMVEGIEAPECLPALFAGEPGLPAGIVGVPYFFSIPFSGDLPLSLSAEVKPDWMSIDVSGSNINLSGTPGTGDDGSSIAVSFTVTNACGSDDFADTVDIAVSARTLTFTARRFGVPSSTITAQFNQPIDADVTIDLAYADGYTSADCSTSPSCSTQITDISLPAGTTSGSDSALPSGDWTAANSFTMYNIHLLTAGFIGNVFPGDVITMGSYDVTIIFDGC